MGCAADFTGTRSSSVGQGSCSRQPFLSSSLPFEGHRRIHTPRAKRASVLCVTAPNKPRLSYVGLPRIVREVDGMRTALGAWATVQEEHLKAPSITKSDTQFRSESLEFVWGTEDVNLVELNDLFEKVGFPKRDLGKLKIALDNTHAVIWIRSTRGSRWAKLGQLLGFARATSDKALSATIWDVAVHPAWQRCGLGRGLVERLTAALVEDDIQTICLYAEPGVVGMYEKLGFVKDPHGVKGMAFQRKSDAGRALLAGAA